MKLAVNGSSVRQAMYHALEEQDLNVRNYECLATLKSNIKQVYINETWVVEKYLTMEKKKLWHELDTDNNMRVLTLERELLP